MPNHPLRLGIALAVVTLVVAACGQILPRPTPTPPPPTATFTRLAPPTSTDTPPPPEPTATPTEEPQPTATFTPEPPAGTALKVGQPARVLARDGLNVREKPGTQSKRLGRFAAGALVTVEDGPVQADGYRWWQVADKSGLKGWVAEASPQGEVWLSPQIGEPRPVARPVRKGDRVTVTSDQPLSLRFQAGLNAVVDRRVALGSQFTVQDGPVEADGLRWWLLVDENGREGWAAEGKGNERWLTPIE